VVEQNLSPEKNFFEIFVRKTEGGLILKDLARAGPREKIFGRRKKESQKSER
jgi:hypothetical protein